MHKRSIDDSMVKGRGPTNARGYMAVVDVFNCKAEKVSQVELLEDIYNVEVKILCSARSRNHAVSQSACRHRIC